VARLISWSTTTLVDGSGKPHNVIAAGVDITESKRLEKAVLDISARERRRIAQDLHDGLGQHLTGIAFLSKVLQERLGDGLPAESAEAARIVQLVNEAIDKTRELSRGLLPVGPEPLGLMTALERWAEEVENLFGLDCRFTCPEPILVHDEDVATHSYRIAQEAVNNAIRHARATRIDIRLEKEGGGFAMRVADNGVGIREDPRSGATHGLGLQIMNYRARMIGGELRVERGPESGTVVTCKLHAGHGGDGYDSV
jgi:signal transduction histidine kinase